MAQMERYWLLTWTTYGTWLPGDRRGFVSEVRDEAGDKALHNLPGTPYDEDMPALEAYAASIMCEDAVWLDLPKAQAVADQLRETAGHRGWWILVLAVMANHVHVVVGVPGDPDPEKILADFKAWATRRLKRGWAGREHWWTAGGSKRPKKAAEAIRAAVVYVRDQPNALVVWIDPRVAARLAELEEAELEEGERRGVSPPVPASDTPASDAASDTPASDAASDAPAS
jgi:REP element-mobilizing transposase RayT